MARIVDLAVTRYDWIPGDAGITTPSGPKVTELTAAGAVNISPYVVVSTAVGPTASDTAGGDKGITDTANVVVPTVGNYEGNLVLFRDMTAGVATANDPWDVFTGAGILGWLVRRIGLAHSEAYAVGQKIEVYKFMTDNPQPSGGQSDGYLKLTVPLLQQGSFKTNVTTVA